MKPRRLLVNIALMIGTAFVFTLILDRALILLDFPTEVRPKVTHPPNYSNRVRNIEFNVDFSTNSQGLRNPEIPLEKEEGEYRILVAGDSFIQGIGVEMEQTIPAQLEQILSSEGNPIRVINGGLAGTGPVAYGKLIFHLLDIYDIDAVLISLFANDVNSTWDKSDPQSIYAVEPQRWGADRWAHALWPRIHTLVRTAAKELAAPGEPRPSEPQERRNKFEAVAYEAAKRGIDPSRISAWKRDVESWLGTLTPKEREGILRGEFGWNILAYGLSRPDYWSTSIDLNSPHAIAKWEAMADVVEEIVAGLRARGKEVALIYIPSKFQYDPASHDPLNAWKVGGSDIRPTWLSGELEIDRRLAELAGRAQVPFLNLTASLRQAVAGGSDLNWRHDEHLNAAGNRYSAERVAEWITSQRVFSGIR